MDKRYLQLYSLGSDLRDDFEGSLTKVAEMGYTGVEFAGGFYGGKTVTELKALLSGLGLEALSSHLQSAMVPDQLDYAVELGLKYIIDPMNNFSDYDSAMRFAETLNATGKLCADRGIRFGYHNHRHEFLEGPDGYLLETLMKNTDPKLVCFQLDVGWAACSGVDSAAFITKHAGRFPLIHVKECNKVAGAEKPADYSAYPKDEYGRPVIPEEVRARNRAIRSFNGPSGEGIIDWPKVVAAANAQGAEGYIVEREYIYAGTIFECVKADCDFLKTL
jgi:sugar phosphate isomerase/epimerase